MRNFNASKLICDHTAPTSVLLPLSATMWQHSNSVPSQ